MPYDDGGPFSDAPAIVPALGFARFLVVVGKATFL